MMKKILITIAALCALLGVAVQFYPIPEEKSQNPRVICFGDSITKGPRFNGAESYPYQLGLLLDEEVINTAIWGETSTHALGRIEADVLAKNPELVIIQFGGNDPGKRIPFAVTMTNNERMVAAIQKHGAKAVLLLGEYNMFEPPYLEGFRTLAKKTGVLLIEDAIKPIMNNPELRIDAVHPNARGNRILAEKIYAKIKSLL